jgi:hypothetical protein
VAGVTGLACPSDIRDLASHTPLNNPIDGKRGFCRAYTRARGDPPKRKAAARHPGKEASDGTETKRTGIVLRRPRFTPPRLLRPPHPERFFDQVHAKREPRTRRRL